MAGIFILKTSPGVTYGYHMGEKKWFTSSPYRGFLTVPSNPLIMMVVEDSTENKLNLKLPPFSILVVRGWLQ